MTADRVRLGRRALRLMALSFFSLLSMPFLSWHSDGRGALGWGGPIRSPAAHCADACCAPAQAMPVG